MAKQNINYTEAWELKPHEGLGHLRFGMTPEEVAAYDNIYGKPESKLDRGIIQGKRYTKESRKSHTLQLIFWDGLLEEIRVTEIKRKKEPGYFNYRGQTIFHHMDHENVIRAMCEQLGEIPVAHNQDAAFLKSCIYLWDFTYWDWNRNITRYTSNPYRSHERSVTWMREPRLYDSAPKTEPYKPVPFKDEIK